MQVSAECILSITFPDCFGKYMYAFELIVARVDMILLPRSSNTKLGIGCLSIATIDTGDDVERRQRLALKEIENDEENILIRICSRMSGTK